MSNKLPKQKVLNPNALTIEKFTEVQWPLVKRLATINLDSIHMVDGALTEILEFEGALISNDHGNMREELGDMIFFLAGFTKVHGLGTLDRSKSIFKQENSTRSVDTAGLEVANRILIKLVDINKGVLVYNRTYDDKYDEMETRINTVYDIVCNCIEQLQWTVEEILEKNYEKLHKVRYKDGYSDHAANNRDLDTEKKILDQ